MRGQIFPDLSTTFPVNEIPCVPVAILYRWEI